MGGDDYAPYIFCDDNGEFAGIDVEIAKEVCKIMGYTPRFVNIDWSDKDRLLKEGKIDCLWDCFFADGQRKRIQLVRSLLKQQAGGSRARRQYDRENSRSRRKENSRSVVQ